MLWREHIGNRHRHHFPHRKAEKLKRKNADGKCVLRNGWSQFFDFALLFALSVWLKCSTGFGGDRKVCRGESECAHDIDCHKFPSMRATIDFFYTLILYLTHSSRFFLRAHTSSFGGYRCDDVAGTQSCCRCVLFTSVRLVFFYFWLGDKRAAETHRKRFHFGLRIAVNIYIMCCLNGRWIQFGGLRLRWIPHMIQHDSIEQKARQKVQYIFGRKLNDPTTTLNITHGANDTLIMGL